MKLEKKNFHERDRYIEFDEEPHVYFVNGVAYDISVTGFVHEFFSKFDGEKVVEKFYDRWQQSESSKYYGMLPQEILDSWEENRVKQADAGTFLHNCIELFYNDESYENETKEHKLFMSFHESHKGMRPYRTEWMVYDEKLKLAGSIDMCFVDDDGSVSLCDWKRSKEIKEQNRYNSGLFPLSHLPDSNYWHYCLQLNIYKYILEKNYSLRVKDMFLVVLHPNNDSYQKIEVVDLGKEIGDMFKIRLDNIRGTFCKEYPIGVESEKFGVAEHKR